LSLYTVAFAVATKLTPCNGVCVNAGQEYYVKVTVFEYDYFGLQVLSGSIN